LSAPIGITINAATPRPATAHAEDHHAADRAMDLQTRLFIDPLLGRGYPERHLAAVPGAEVPVEEGDMEIISGKIDYLGLNFYHEDAARFAADAPEEFRFVPQYQGKTEMGWPITPEGFARHLRSIYAYTNGIPLYVTENGAAMPDVLNEDGTRCHDYDRIAYLRSHLAAARRVIREGVDLRGYFLWSFIDNFEWAFGYTKRFGLVYCDYETQRRIPKDSFYFYRDVIAGAE
jgi:beta-glucosidase